MPNVQNAPVAVVMGSENDLSVMQGCIDQLKEFGIQPIVRVLSAHRTPVQAMQFAQTAAQKGIKIIIAAAGMAAHLGGAMAANSHLPIIAVPLQASEGPCGLDALLAMVQMPPGMPVGTMAIGKAGAKNAAIYAVQMLALSDPTLEKKLIEFRQKQTEKALQKDAQLNA